MHMSESYGGTSRHQSCVTASNDTLRPFRRIIVVFCSVKITHALVIFCVGFQLNRSLNTDPQKAVETTSFELSPDVEALRRFIFPLSRHCNVNRTLFSAPVRTSSSSSSMFRRVSENMNNTGKKCKLGWKSGRGEQGLSHWGECWAWPGLWNVLS